VTLTDAPAPDTTAAPDRLKVVVDEVSYPAEAVAHGAAFEIFASTPGPGFLDNPRPGARLRYRRFVPATEAVVVQGATPEPEDTPLTVPLSRTLSWDAVQRLSQSPQAGRRELLAAVRTSAVLRRGTRMVKPLTRRQLGHVLHGALPSGFCYREYDIAHLRTPTDLMILDSTAEGFGEVAFALLWRAVDPVDYAIPDAVDYAGLCQMPPKDRIGSAVLGTGFVPSGQHLVPEFVTADLADLPLTAGATLVAFTADGTEVMLYRYQPEQRAWTRLFGPQWRHLFSGVPGISPEQEYFSVPATTTRLVGRHGGHVLEALADPPHEFRVLARTRAARYPVTELARRTIYVTWRQTPCTVVGEDGAYLRLRLIRPESAGVVRTGATCVERGIYEVWAPSADVTDVQQMEIGYRLDAQ
jgi:hypothetical protein